MEKNEKDDKKLDQETTALYVSNCVACLLAVNLRTCATCKFNLGLPVRVAVLSKMAENNPLLLQVI